MSARRYVTIDHPTGQMRVRVLAEAEGWLMVRRPHAMPFVVPVRAVQQETDK